MASGRSLVIGEQFGVFPGAEQLLYISGLVDADLEHPTGAVGILVDLFGVFFQALVYFENLAGSWGNEVGDLSLIHI